MCSGTQGSAAQHGPAGGRIALSLLAEHIAIERALMAICVLFVPTLMQWTVEVELIHSMRVIAGILAFVMLNADASKKAWPSQSIPESIQQLPAADDKEAVSQVTELRPTDDKGAVSQVTELRPIHDKGAVSQITELRPLSVACTSLEEQTAEVVAQLKPTEECHQVVERLRQLLQKRICSFVPGAEVCVHVSSPFWRNTPYAAAVPEIEVVVDASPRALYTYMQGIGSAQCFEGNLWHVLQAGDGNKQVLRCLVKSLLKNGDFRFRRSSFSQQEAKVIMVAPNVGNAEQVVAFNLWLNAKWPLRNTQLVDTCAEADGRMRDLFLLVRRWAKVRGMSIACQGYLSPLSWTILVVYFLQVKGLLPAFLCAADQDMQPVVTVDLSNSANSMLTVAQLFHAFVSFYHNGVDEFDWNHEKVDISKAVREFSQCPAKTRPFLADPFQQEWQLSQSVTESGLNHIHAQFARAVELLRTSSAPMAQLLERWEPPNLDDQPLPSPATAE